MKNSKWKSYVFWILLTEGVGVLSGWLSRDGVRQFSETAVQPSFSPPALSFPVVWTVLYALMGIGMAMVSLTPAGEQREKARGIWILQLIVNFFWSLFFFNLQAYGFSLAWLLLLWLLIVVMIQRFRQVDSIAAWLQVPYLLWVTFAAWLNWSIWQLNG